MAERTDLDALLISALYGELAPADEARLAAHLESHPADRTALADLTHTRDAVRASRLFAVQLEPPQSVSARLLQEAARSAPRPAGRSDDAMGWFHRFTRAFIAHPAMATAATFVLVVGVAGTLYIRRGEQVGVPDAATAGASLPPARNYSQETEGKNRAQVATAPSPAPQAAGSDGFRVNLDEAKPQHAAELRQDSRDGQADAPAIVAAPSTVPERRAPLAPKPAKKSGPSGIELRRPEPAEPVPKDFDDDARSPFGGAAMERDTKAAIGAATDKSKLAVRGAGVGAGAPPAQAVRPAATSGDVSGGAFVASDSAASAPPKPASKAAPRPASGRLAKTDAPAEAQSEPADDTALLAWAQKQHDRVVALVKASNCPAAASAATEIYSRAPVYYAANVANDRAVKPCVSYIASDREREDRRLAAKRAMSNDAAESAAPAAPPAATPRAAKPGASSAKPK
jgi:hypothetical protein